MKEQKRSSEIIDIVMYALKMDCHMCVCSLLQVIKDI